MSIKPEEPVIHVKVLDLVGREFKFDHAKGIAEWLKNSVDAYNHEKVSDIGQVIYIYLNSNSQTGLIKSIDVIDFVGMERKKIDAGFKCWFDPEAARRQGDGRVNNIPVLGGHGNGGKFYMREMFKTSRLITFRNNHINCFGFDEKKQYGFETEMDNKKATIQEALKLAEIDSNEFLKKELVKILLEKKRFTIVRGYGPESKNVHKTNHINDLIKKLLSHPQAKRIIQHKTVFLLHGNQESPVKLEIPLIEPKKGFENKYEYTCPETLEYENEQITMCSNKPVKLTLFTSEEPLTGNKFKGRNSIDFLSDVGVIANYDISKLGQLKYSGFSEFIYGECDAQVMEDEEYVTNDRNQFADNVKTKALLYWTKECIDKLCENMEEVAKRERRNINLKKTSDLNSLLDKWKNRFLIKMFMERAAGLGSGEGIGGNSDRTPVVGTGEKKHKKNDSETKTGSEGGSKIAKASLFPEVKISGMDTDPFSKDSAIFEIDARQTPVYQRPVDFQNRLYWINTSKKIARMILEKNGPESVRACCTTQGEIEGDYFFWHKNS